jgi:hypothetical protein
MEMLFWFEPFGNEDKKTEFLGFGERGKEGNEKV